MTDRETLDYNVLNGIAIDLGLPTFSNFEDGTEYMTDSLNGITSALVGKGVTTALNKCLVTLNSSTITIATGLIIFESGAKKKITTPITLNLIAGAKNYIYAKNDTTLNVIVVETSATEPSGDYVLLATIENGVVSVNYDRFSSSKTANLGTNLTQSFTIWKATIANDEVFWESDLDLTKYNVVALEYDAGVAPSSSNAKNYGIFDVENGLNIFHYMQKYYSNDVCVSSYNKTAVKQQYYRISSSSTKSFELYKESNKIKLKSVNVETIEQAKPIYLTFY